MPTDTRKIKERLTSRGNFTPEQANDIIEALFEVGDPVITRSVLRAELNRMALKIIAIQTGLFALLLTLFELYT